MKMMKKVMCLACLMMIAACGQTDQPGVDKQPIIGEPYQSECLSGNWAYGENSDSIEVLVSGDAMTIVDHYAEFNCCLDAWMEVSIAGNQITVVEKEDPDKSGACYCMCPFELSIEVSNLADGTYLVKVFREDWDGGLTQLFEQSVQVPDGQGPDCLADSDCAENEECVEGECQPIEPECQADSDCAENEECVAGECQPVEPECQQSSDCAENEECVGGECQPVEPECQQSSDCAENEECVDGECLPVQAECTSHEDCNDRTSMKWCIQGECLEGSTPCQAAGGICTLESECPDGFYSVLDPSYMNCAWCGYCCLSSGCPELIDCPQGTTCQADGTCLADCQDPEGCDPQPECTAPVDCLNLPWDIYCTGHWDCVETQCQPVCDMEACGDGTCDYAAGESPNSCPDDCGC
jgi:hypothetical protein